MCCAFGFVIDKSLRQRDCHSKDQETTDATEFTRTFLDNVADSLTCSQKLQALAPAASLAVFDPALAGVLAASPAAAAGLERTPLPWP